MLGVTQDIFQVSATIVGCMKNKETTDLYGPPLKRWALWVQRGMARCELSDNTGVVSLTSTCDRRAEADGGHL